MSFMIDELKADGFIGFVPLRSFQKVSILREGLDAEGVYAVVRESVMRPVFLEDTHPKPRPKIYTAGDAEARWINGAQILYFGKGPLRKPRHGRRQGLAQRIHEMRAHGYAGAANHYGGKLLWQVEDRGTLLVAWKVVADGAADATETALIKRFMATDDSHRTPFANVNQKGLRRG
jgi:hypothetical protein